MSGDGRQGVVDSIRERIDTTGESLGQVANEVNEAANRRLDDAVDFVGGGKTSASEFVDNMGNNAVEVVGVVLSKAEEYLAEHDLDITISGNRIRIEGDEEGLKKLKAELRDTDALKGRDAHIHYDRTEGLNIDFGSSE